MPAVAAQQRPSVTGVIVLEERRLFFAAGLLETSHDTLLPHTRW
jgi:hypothetical protein